MVTKPSSEQSQDFSIHNEDFPALPGPNYKDPTSAGDDSKTVSSSLTQTLCRYLPSWHSLILSTFLPRVFSLLFTFSLCFSPSSLTLSLT